MHTRKNDQKRLCLCVCVWIAFWRHIHGWKIEAKRGKNQLKETNTHEKLTNKTENAAPWNYINRLKIKLGSVQSRAAAERSVFGIICIMYVKSISWKTNDGPNVREADQSVYVRRGEQLNERRCYCCATKKGHHTAHTQHMYCIV